MAVIKIKVINPRISPVIKIGKKIFKTQK